MSQTKNCVSISTEEKMSAKKILSRFQKMSDDQFIFHDVVEDCINPYTNVSLLDGRETPEEKFLKFREAAFDYDADVSAESMVVASAVYSGITGSGQWELQPQEKTYITGKNGKGFILNKEGLLFELKSEERFYTLRCDTMNSVATTNRAYRKCFGTKELPEDAMKLMDLYHTFGNFFLIPFKADVSLNGPRGIGKSKDYFDLFLLSVYWFFETMRHLNDGCIRVELEGLEEIFGNLERAEFYGGYLAEHFIFRAMRRDEYSGRRPWDAFVEENLLQDHVWDYGDGTYGMPKELWNGHFSGEVMPHRKEEFIEFYQNGVDRILRRNIRVYERLHMKQAEHIQ